MRKIYLKNGSKIGYIIINNLKEKKVSDSHIKKERAVATPKLAPLEVTTPPPAPAGENALP